MDDGVAKKQPQNDLFRLGFFLFVKHNGKRLQYITMMEGRGGEEGGDRRAAY